ncbi:hypothetical protein MSG28_000791 [Choristoneura fumiferana]|uniref:Uncharacterized protein n=1 Tax=Choristoneura fumiferana TaxID=7141 RepID=A0ACC0K2J6_CHOFU|nr:hypothetical protein MSG28_000791 [Choristoneura fumiferana]
MVLLYHFRRGFNIILYSQLDVGLESSKAHDQIRFYFEENECNDLTAHTLHLTRHDHQRLRFAEFMRRSAHLICRPVSINYLDEDNNSALYLKGGKLGIMNESQLESLSFVDVRCALGQQQYPPPHSAPELREHRAQQQCAQQY